MNAESLYKFIDYMLDILLCILTLNECLSISFIHNFIHRKLLTREHKQWR